MDIVSEAKAIVMGAEAHIVEGAKWLVNAVSLGQAGWADMKADAPIVAQAAAVATVYAEAHGVPVAQVEAVGDAVLNVAKVIAAGTPAPSSPVA